MIKEQIAHLKRPAKEKKEGHAATGADDDDDDAGLITVPAATRMRLWLPSVLINLNIFCKI